MNKYRVIAICGKSASGKDTYLQQMLNHLGDKVHEIISHTTRPPREGEVNGKNYYFITEENFTTKLANNEMLEWATYRNWYYGTAIEALNKDKINIGVFNRKGIESLSKREDIDLFVVLMLAGGKTRLLRSLNREEFPDVDEIVRRYQADEEEWKEFKNFHFILCNEGQGIDPKRSAAITDCIVEEAKCLWAKVDN